MLLNKNAILSIKDISYEDMYIDEWKGTVRLYMLSAAERYKFESKYILDGKVSFNRGNAPVELVSLCMRDESGDRIFSDEDIASLRKKSGKTISILFNKCIELNWISEAAIIESKKNLEETQ